MLAAAANAINLSAPNAEFRAIASNRGDRGERGSGRSHGGG